MATNTVSFQPRYELQYRPNPQDENERKWYAKAISNGTIDTEALAKTISARCTVTRHDVRAVLSAFQETIVEYLKMGCAVKLDDLGYFRLEVKSKGSLTADKFTSALIHNTMLRFKPSDNLSTEVKALTEQWTSNGVADTKVCQEQYARENPKP